MVTVVVSARFSRNILASSFSRTTYDWTTDRATINTSNKLTERLIFSLNVQFGRSVDPHTSILYGRHVTLSTVFYNIRALRLTGNDILTVDRDLFFYRPKLLHICRVILTGKKITKSQSCKQNCVQQSRCECQFTAFFVMQGLRYSRNTRGSKQTLK
jgi:hypothetical protein